MTDPDAWRRADNVLCVRLDNLGDVLMTTPALRALKESRPGRRLTLLTSPGAAAVGSLVPEADACLVYDAAGKRVARYDKVHLFDVDIPGKAEKYRESANVAPGSRTVVVGASFNSEGTASQTAQITTLHA